MRHCLMLLVLVVAAAICGCGEDKGSNEFSFIVLSDIHVRVPGNPDNRDYDNAGIVSNLTRTVATINTSFSGSEFVMVTGDLVGCLFSENPADYLTGQPNPAETVKDIMSGLGVPWHPALGNHDYHSGYDLGKSEMIPARSQANIEAVWRKVLGIEPYYSFLHKGVRFVVLNSSKGPASAVVCPFSQLEAMCLGSFDTVQMSWLEQELQKPEPCLLFFHHPVITDNSDIAWSFLGRDFQVDENDRFYDIASAYTDKIKAIFVGHGHMWATDTLFGAIPVYETASTGDYLGQADNMSRVTVDVENGVFRVEQRAGE
ncbi:MAG: metallophosphoesterase [bacterium]